MNCSMPKLATQKLVCIYICTCTKKWHMELSILAPVTHGSVPYLHCCRGTGTQCSLGTSTHSWSKHHRRELAWRNWNSKLSLSDLVEWCLLYLAQSGTAGAERCGTLAAVHSKTCYRLHICIEWNMIITQCNDPQGVLAIISADCPVWTQAQIQKSP